MKPISNSISLNLQRKSFYGSISLNKQLTAQTAALHASYCNFHYYGEADMHFYESNELLLVAVREFPLNLIQSSNVAHD